MKRVMDFLYFTLSFRGLAVGSFLIGLAATPSVFLVRTMRMIKIGNNVNIGADTLILPGVTIEDNVIVGANSLVPKEARLEKDSVYGGVPVKKIR
jgi:acetyltransferase-like isoleucine patch superfamily enzyme